MTARDKAGVTNELDLDSLNQNLMNHSSSMRNTKINENRRYTIISEVEASERHSGIHKSWNIIIAPSNNTVRARCSRSKLSINQCTSIHYNFRW